MELDRELLQGFVHQYYLPESQNTDLKVINWLPVAGDAEFGILVNSSHKTVLTDHEIPVTSFAQEHLAEGLLVAYQSGPKPWD